MPFYVTANWFFLHFIYRMKKAVLLSTPYFSISSFVLNESVFKFTILSFRHLRKNLLIIYFMSKAHTRMHNTEWNIKAPYKVWITFPKWPTLTILNINLAMLWLSLLYDLFSMSHAFLPLKEHFHLEDVINHAKSAKKVFRALPFIVNK
jgi:hypothetical protein